MNLVPRLEYGLRCGEHASAGNTIEHATFDFERIRDFRSQ